MKMFNTYTHNIGSALITALFIMTLIAIAATAMTARLQLDIYRTRLILTQDQMNYASQMVTFWAISELTNKKTPYSSADRVGKVSEFPAQLLKTNLPFQMQGALYDLQSRFNLNNLIDPNYFLVFIHLLNNPHTTFEQDEKKKLVLLIHQWISAYQPQSGIKDNSEDYYLSHNPPYLIAHQLLQTLSELRLIQGINRTHYIQLSSLVSTLPEITPFNINTIPPALLPILGYGLDEEQVNDILKKRSKKGIQSPKQLANLVKKLHIKSDQVTLVSQYFLLVSTITNHEITQITYTVLKRTQDKKGKNSVSLLTQHRHSD